MGVSRVLAATALLIFSPVPPALPQERSAGLVVRNAAVYTVDTARSRARALAVKGGRIVFVGGDREAGGWVGSTTKVVRRATGRPWVLMTKPNTAVFPRRVAGRAR